MSRLSFFSLTIVVCLTSGLQVTAGASETTANGEIVPQEIRQAFEDASKHAHIYVCPRDALKKTDEDFLRLTEEIRQRFQRNFATEAYEIQSLPTTCHSPKSYPGFAAKAESYAGAVKHLEEVLRDH
jgi:1-acyl-sn-glycerol-3-phosphate acyltransferase